LIQISHATRHRRHCRLLAVSAVISYAVNMNEAVHRGTIPFLRTVAIKATGMLVQWLVCSSFEGFPKPVTISPGSLQTISVHTDLGA